MYATKLIAFWAAAAVAAAACPSARGGAQEARTAEPIRGRRVERSTVSMPRLAVPGDVSRDSLEAMVRFLSRDPANGGFRSRFCLRVASLDSIADSLAGRLERYTGGIAERHPFHFLAPSVYGGDLVTNENIAVRLAGNGTVPGMLLVTAHYDAIASATPGWAEAWESAPAPGADDNASGVAAVLETARVLGEAELPFDVLFVLFSAEELGLIGSRDFADNFELLYPGEEIIGVINCDMFGYAIGGRIGGTVVANIRSGWLADLMLDAAGILAPALPIALLKPGPGNSDHAAFWETLRPAVTVIEPLVGPSIGSPYYHTTADTAGTFSFEQPERLTRLVAGFVSHLAGRSPELAILPSDIIVARGGLPMSRRVFASGDSINLWIHVRNVGSAPVAPEASVRLVVSLENARGRRQLMSGSIAVPDPLAATLVDIPLAIDASLAGENVVRASIDVSGADDDPTDNAASERFSVAGGGDLIISHGTRPSPMQGSLGSCAFCLELAREAEGSVELLTVEGEKVGFANLGERYGRPLEAGLNCFAFTSLFPNRGDIASGIYLYRIKATGTDGVVSAANGKLAVVR